MTSADEQAGATPGAAWQVQGNPTAAELAALVAVLAAACGTAEQQPAPSVPSRWRDPLRAVRQPWYARPGAWSAGNWGLR